MVEEEQPPVPSELRARPRFSYTPLDLDREDIRIIHILRGSEDDVISCTVEKGTLNRSYVCLSYTWGDEHDPTHEILLDGATYRVRQNLHDFLHEARRRCFESALWIDAICIDQRNIKEREQQVQQMSKIYEQARYVITWLGLGSPALTTALLKYDNAETKLTAGRSALALFTSQECNAMFRSMSHSYWSRLWVVQEALLARSLVMWSGPLSLPMLRYMSTIDSLYRSEKFHAHKDNMFCSSETRSTSFDPCPEHPQTTSLERCQSQQYAYEAPRNTCFHLIRRELDRAHVTLRPIGEVVARLWNFQSREPLDQIYGLLGLAYDSDRVNVNYQIRPLALLLHFIDTTGCSMLSSRLLLRLGITYRDVGDYLRHLPYVSAIPFKSSREDSRPPLWQILPRSGLPGHRRSPENDERNTALEQHSWRVETDRLKDQDKLTDQESSRVTWFCTRKPEPGAKLQYLRAVVWSRLHLLSETSGSDSMGRSGIDLYFDQTCPQAYLNSLLRPPCGYVVTGVDLSGREGRTDLGYIAP
jgi:hypothetical protein